MRLAGMVSLILALWGGALLLQVPREPPEARRLPGGAEIRLFAPEEEPPWQALVCLHSVFQDPDTAEVPARAAARAGMAGVQVRLPPGGSFEDHLAACREVLAALRRDPRVGAVFLYGHSMGADLAVTVASDDPGVPGVVAAGFPVEGAPRRLLLAVGAWDELHPLSEMSKAAASAGAPLVVLPAADHAAETVSPDLHEAVAAWCGARQGVALRPDPFVGRGLLALGLVLPLWWLGRWPALLALAGSFAVPVPGVPAGVGLAALCALSLASTDLRALLPLAARRLAVALGIAGVALAVNSWESLLDGPGRILGLAVFLAQAVPLAAARAGSSLAPLGAPGWGMAAWLALEALAPGALARGVAAVHRRVVAAVERLDLRPRLDVSPVSAVVLLACLGAAALAWREVARAGYVLDPEEILRLGGLFARLVGLPAFLLFLAVRKGLWSGPP